MHLEGLDLLPSDVLAADFAERLTQLESVFFNPPSPRQAKLDSGEGLFGKFVFG